MKDASITRKMLLFCYCFLFCTQKTTATELSIGKIGSWWWRRRGGRRRLYYDERTTTARRKEKKIGSFLIYKYPWKMWSFIKFFSFWFSFFLLIHPYLRLVGNRLLVGCYQLSSSPRLHIAFFLYRFRIYNWKNVVLVGKV